MLSSNRKTQPRLWHATFLVNRGLVRGLRSEINRYFTPAQTARVLDVGCGAMPYRDLFSGHCTEYIGCDAHPQRPGVIQCLADDLKVPHESFDAVVSFQVLEHVKRPWRVVAECARVLKKQGILLLSAPFLFPHHSSPHDFFRFTHEGLAALAEDAGLKVENISAHCSSFSTLMLLLNWQLMRPLNKLRARSLTRPLAVLGTALLVVPVNLLGLLFETRLFNRSFTKGNEGNCNFLIVCRKAA